MAISSTMEEYIEAIYRLGEKKSSTRTTDLAKYLRVTPATITDYIENLEKHGLVVHRPYRGVRLTDRGRRIALDVIRRHRLSERLLTDILKMDWSKVHDEACKFEHSIGEDIVNSLEKVLGHPKICPHGNPIPTKCGGIIEEESKPLASMDLKESGTVVKITEEKTDVLRHLATLGLIPGASIIVEKKTPFDGPITIKVKKTTHTIGHDLASVIWIKVKMERVNRG